MVKKTDCECDKVPKEEAERGSKEWSRQLRKLSKIAESGNGKISTFPLGVGQPTRVSQAVL